MNTQWTDKTVDHPNALVRNFWQGMYVVAMSLFLIGVIYLGTHSC
jgi:hypothetical protein